MEDEKTQKSKPANDGAEGQSPKNENPPTIPEKEAEVARFREHRPTEERNTQALIALHEPTDVPASAERAAEIARMEEFGQLEFWELTGVRCGPYGLYDVTEGAVVLRLAKTNPEWRSEERCPFGNAAKPPQACRTAAQRQAA